MTKKEAPITSVTKSVIGEFVMFFCAIFSLACALIPLKLEWGNQIGDLYMLAKYWHYYLGTIFFAVIASVIVGVKSHNRKVEQRHGDSHE